MNEGVDLATKCVALEKIYQELSLFRCQAQQGGAGLRKECKPDTILESGESQKQNYVYFQLNPEMKFTDDRDPSVPQICRGC